MRRDTFLPTYAKGLQLFLIGMLATALALSLSPTTGMTAGSFTPVTLTDQTPTQPLANPVPSSFQPRYISGFGSGDSFTVFFEDRDASGKISYASTTTGPVGFPANATATNIADTHFVVKDWPINISGTDYAYRAWGSVGNNLQHHFYVSNDLANWTLVSTFTIPNASGFTDANGWVYYGFHDVIQLNGTYYAFAESNQSQTMIVRSANGDDVWEAFDSVGGRPGDGPLELPAGVTVGWTPSGSFVDLGHDRGYGKVYVDPRDSDFYLAVNTAAKPSLPPAALEAAFIDPANWTWHDGTTGPAANPILSETSEHDLRECWVVPNTDPNAPWVIVYDADYGVDDGGKALGYATLTPPLPPDDQGPLTSNIDPTTAPVNTDILLTATVDDSTTGGSNITSAEYSLDGGANWSPMSASDGTFDYVAEDVEAPIGSFSEPQVLEVCVRGTDAPGNIGPEECVFLAIFDPDAGFVTGGGWIDSPPGAYKPNDHDSLQTVWFQGFETDASGWLDSDDAWYGTVTRVPSGTGGVVSSSGAYHAVFEGDEDSAPFTRFDGYRDTWRGTWKAGIDVYLDPSWTSGTGFDYSVAASGSDGNHQRDFIFHVTEDTSTGSLLVAGSNNTNFAPREDLENINHYEVTTAGWYTFQHVFYEDSGALAVDLNLLDSNGNVLFAETRFNAADTIPDEVGGNRYGWFTFINVDGGIAVDDHRLDFPTVTGKANFGFVAKYKKGVNVPEGNTEFQFKAGDLNFHSSEYDWLVVNQGGTNAQFKGRGTINGAGDYKFMLWATDGDPDTFRIKIWEQGGGVVYDNGTDQEIGGGNIVVHKK